MVAPSTARPARWLDTAFAPLRHFDLSDYGVSKHVHEDFDPAEAMRLLDLIRKQLRDAPRQSEELTVGPSTGSGKLSSVAVKESSTPSSAQVMGSVAPMGRLMQPTAP